jgi:hypothetical protein
MTNPKAPKATKILSSPLILGNTSFQTLTLIEVYNPYQTGVVLTIRVES